METNTTNAKAQVRKVTQDMYVALHAALAELANRGYSIPNEAKDRLYDVFLEEFWVWLKVERDELSEAGIDCGPLNYEAARADYLNDLKWQKHGVRNLTVDDVAPLKHPLRAINNPATKQLTPVRSGDHVQFIEHGDIA